MNVKGIPLLKSDAGQKLVNYDFKLLREEENLNSDYFDSYKFDCDQPKDVHECYDEVMNPEDSWMESKFYQRHFAENWYVHLIGPLL